MADCRCLNHTLARAVFAGWRRFVFCPERLKRWARLSGLCLLLLLGLSACTTPVGTQRVSERRAYQQLDRSALNSRQPSDAALLVLRRFNLEREFKRRPAAALEQLLDRAKSDSRRDIVYALAELACLHADRLSQSVKPGACRQAPDFYLLAAIASYTFLFGDASYSRPSPYERQFRNACDLYARALALAFSDPAHPPGSVLLRAGSRRLLGHDLQVTLSTDGFPYTLDRFSVFIPANSLAIRGISTRDTDSGLGAPLVGVFSGTLPLQLSGDRSSDPGGTI